MSMKTILYDYHASNIGGGSYAMLSVIKALDRTKYQPVVLLKSYGPLVEELKKLNVDVYFILTLNTVPYNKSWCTLRNIYRIYNLLKSFKPFKRLLLELNPDIVYLNTMMLHPYLRIIKSLGLRSIIHVREHWPDKEHVLQRNYAINNIREYADEIIAINSYSASMVADENHHPTIVYDWVDMNNRYEEYPYEDIFQEDCSQLKVYLCSGGYDPIKGTVEVAKSFTEVVKDPTARLLILGSKPQIPKPNIIRRLLLCNKKSYVDLLEEIISKDSRIRIIPNTYFVTHLYQQAYCMLSYFKIPHANLALAENIILRTPVIAAKNEESIEYSNNGELAVLFEANNLDDFKTKLKDIDGTRSYLMAKLNDKSEIIEEMFSSNGNIKRLNGVYERLS